MPRRGQAVEIGMDEAEEAAQQALPCKQLRDEVADMAALYVFRLEPGGFEPRQHHIGKTAREIHAFARPVAGEIALRAAEDVDHVCPPLLCSGLLKVETVCAPLNDDFAHD